TMGSTLFPSHRVLDPQRAKLHCEWLCRPCVGGRVVPSCPRNTDALARVGPHPWIREVGRPSIRKSTARRSGRSAVSAGRYLLFAVRCGPALSHSRQSTALGPSRARHIGE